MSSWIVFSSPEKISAKTAKNRKKRKQQNEKKAIYQQAQVQTITDLKNENRMLNQQIAEKNDEILKLKNKLNLAEIEIIKISEKKSELEEKYLLAEVDRYLNN